MEKDLIIRKKNFKILLNNINCIKINDLMLEVIVPKNLIDNITYASRNYLSKCIQIKNNTFLKEDEIIKFFQKKNSSIKNITPNGMIVPKNEFTLEFNTIVKAYVDIINYCNITNFIKNFHFPPNLRIKYPKIKKSHMRRKHPTEMLHADTWTGANHNWIASHIFLLGDVKNNNIQYVEPQKNFREEWLEPLENSEQGIEIAKNFKKINYIPKKGSFILADASILHRSYRNNNCGTRISFDTGFDLRCKYKIKTHKNRIIKNIKVTNLRKKETISNSQFLDVGKKTYFYFPDPVGVKTNSLGGFKHPSNVKLMKFKINK
jgi:hypothetical protein